MGEPRIGRWLSYLMQVSHGIGNIGGVPEDDRGDDEVEPRGAKLLRFGASGSAPLSICPGRFGIAAILISPPELPIARSH